MINKYFVKCRTCDGSGNMRDMPDEDGVAPLINCPKCYRGIITLQLTLEDEKNLLIQIINRRASLGIHDGQK